MESARRWDIFCTVIDNYGDIGVSWRLARQLVREHGASVRLWLDDLAPLAKLCPQASATQGLQTIDGVEVRHWPHPFPATELADGLGDCVIEAFACELPENYQAAMAARQPAPVWINLEYLSAEDWIEGVHGLPSPHPRLQLTKYFFFPGFSTGTGGLLRESDYESRRAGFDAAAFRTQLGLPIPQRDELTISLFGYDNAALPGLLNAWSHSPRPVVCLVPEGRLLPEVERYFGHSAGHHERSLQRGHLTAQVIPFLSQRDYDALLWLCDLNFVRGEDSFVRAQWAEKPFVWHIYPQAEAAHLVKLDAFLSRYLAALPPAAASATRDFWTAWNDNADAARYWPDYAAALPALTAQAPRWSQQIAAHGDLVTRLLHFVQQKAAK